MPSDESCEVHVVALSLLSLQRRQPSSGELFSELLLFSELFRWEGGLSIGRQGLESKVELVYVLVI